MAEVQQLYEKIVIDNMLGINDWEPIFPLESSDVLNEITHNSVFFSLEDGCNFLSNEKLMNDNIDDIILLFQSLTTYSDIENKKKKCIKDQSQIL